MATTLRFLFYCVLLNCAALAVLYPEQLLWRNTRFMFVHDTEYLLENVFALVSHFYQGDIQLYNHFDGLNMAYNQLSWGLYTLSNVLTAAVYVLVSPLLTDSARGFHEIFSVVFYAVNVLLRTVGGYLLVRKFTSNLGIITLALLWLNVFLSSQFMNNGMMTNNLYGYFPLLMYFVLNFFERLRLKDFCCALLVMAIVVANSPLFALGYFYQVVHFLIISCVLVYVCPAPGKFFSRWREGLRKGMNLRNVGYLILAGLASGLIVCPDVILAQSLQQDFYVHGSGLGGAEGRIKDALSADGYFNMPNRAYAQPADFLNALMDYSMCAWPWTWMFVGAGVIFVCVLGLVLSTHRVKYVVVAVTILLLLVNLPSRGDAWYSLAHWLNVFTNPFHFLLRSFHMSALLWPYVLLPLIAAGTQESRNLVQEPFRFSLARRIMALLAVVVAGIIFIGAVEGPVKPYALAGTVMFAGFCILMHLLKSQRHRLWTAGGLLIALLVMDLAAYRVYAAWGLSPDRVITPRVFNIPVTNPLVVDYQNPEILPLRVFYRNNPAALEPLASSFHNSYGQYYRYHNFLECYSRPPSIYEPRPRVFKDLRENGPLLNYMISRDRMMTFSGGDDALAVKVFELDLGQAKRISRRQFMEYRVQLPKSFPSYLSTSVFTADAGLISLKLDTYNLSPVQGALTQPADFDVNNIKKGYLLFAWPVQMSPPTRAMLRIEAPPEITKLWRYTNDELGFDYAAKKDGILTIHYPYDAKWELIIDGQVTKLHKVQDAFLGIPLKQGQHKVLLRYWPHTPLRFLLGLSMLLVIGGWAFVVVQGLKEEPIPA